MSPCWGLDPSVHIVVCLRGRFKGSPGLFLIVFYLFIYLFIYLFKVVFLLRESVFIA